MKPQAIIFDLDGVITDTAHLHFIYGVETDCR